MSKDVIELGSVINEAFEELMVDLFGESYDTMDTHEVARSTYEDAMHRVQNKYGLKQGHPDFLEWVLTLVGRSPKLIEGSDTHEQ